MKGALPVINKKLSLLTSFAAAAALAALTTQGALAQK